MKKNKIKILAICGKSASGKDTILKELSKNENVHTIISCTTRPIRENEQNGIDYYFLSKEEFAKRLMCGDMLEATVFNTWCYGTSLKELDKNKVNVGIFNPEGIEILSENSSVDLTIYYIKVSDKERLLRALNREENPNVKEIIRRYSTDEKDFYGIEDYFKNINILENNNENDLRKCVKEILGKIVTLSSSEI